MLFRFESVVKEFAGVPLLRDLHLQANLGDRIGIIGPNGSGKTALLNLIDGSVEPDHGRIHRGRDLSISRIPQLPDFQGGRTVLEETLEVFADLRQLEQHLATTEAHISDLGGEIPREVADQYERLRVILEQQGGYDYPARTEAVLLGVGFSRGQLDQRCEELSGGQENRLLVAKALLRPAALMLLDEPTNHLDIEGILWLSRFLGQTSQPFLVVSHDRHFLDSVTDSTWELEAGRIYAYVGSYSSARKKREERRKQEQTQYQRQQEWKRRIEEYIRRNIAGQKTKQAQARRKRLEKTEWLEAPKKAWLTFYPKIVESQRGGPVSFELKKAEVGYPGRTLLQDVNLVARRGDRISLVGANGTGKTSLFRLIAGELSPSAGEIHFGQNMTLGYLSQNPQFPAADETVLEYLRKLDPLEPDLKLRSHAAAYGFRGEDAYKTIAHLSGGERSRLAMARLFYRPRNLLLLDEPTNHLDVDSREALEQALNRFEGTQIIISHDIYFIRRVANRLWKIEDGRVREVKSLAEFADAAVPSDRSRAKAQAKVRKKAVSAGPKFGLSKNERFRRERELEKVEKGIAELEEEKQRLLSRLEHEVSFHLLSELGHTHDQLDAQLQELYQRWEELASELDE